MKINQYYFFIILAAVLSFTQCSDKQHSDKTTTKANTQPQSNFYKVEKTLLDSIEGKIKQYANVNLDSILFYTGEAQRIYTKQKDLGKYIEAFMTVASTAGNLGEIKTMKRYIDTTKYTVKQYNIAPDHPEHISAHQWDFYYYYLEENFKKSTEQLEIAVALLESRSAKGMTTEDSMKLFTINTNRCVVYCSYGNYEKGLESGFLALSYLPQYQRNINYIGEGQLYNNIGAIYFNKKDHKNATLNYRKALDIYRHTDTSHVVAFYNLTNLYNNFASNFSINEQYDSALLYLNYALDTHYLKQQFNLPEIGAAYHAQRFDRFYHNMGYAYFKKGVYAKAIKHTWHSIRLKERTDNDLSKRLTAAKGLSLLGDIHAAQGQYLTALQFYQKAIAEVILPFSETQNIYKHPELKEIVSEQYLLDALKNKGRIFYKLHQQTGAIKDLDAAFQTYTLATQLVEQIRRGYKAERAKEYLSETSLPVFESAIEIAAKLYMLEKDDTYLKAAFQFAEKSKAVSLLEALKHNEAKQFTGVPAELLEQESALKIALAKNERLYYEAKRNNKPDSIVALYRQAFYEKSEDYDFFIMQLETDYPNYYQLKYNDDIVTIAEIQEDLLEEHTAFLEYFVGDSIVSIFTITKDTATIQLFKQSPAFIATINQFRKVLSNSDSLALPLHLDYHLKTIGTNGHQLYQSLLQRALAVADTINQLIIVPDGILGHIPFEVLIREPKKPTDDFRTLAYLLRDYDIAYAYSGRLLHQTEHSLAERKASKTYAGFAAHYPSSDEVKVTSDTLLAPPIAMKPSTVDLLATRDTRGIVNDLPHAKTEIKTVANLVGGRGFIKNAATEANFIKRAGEYQVLHLSMHGFLEDQAPLLSHLLFTKDSTFNTDGKLTVSEIYNIPLNADLVVLSACNTGFGEIKRGEGVMSLSRAFAYAGCPSTVMSLWSVNDASTSRVMIDFFKNLKQQQRKNTALREAKLKFLKSSDHLLAHPVFWAGFIPMGDMQPIEFQSNISYFKWFLVGGLIFVASLWMFYYRSQRKNQSRY